MAVTDPILIESGVTPDFISVYYDGLWIMMVYGWSTPGNTRSGSCGIFL
jgi:hypothetical protein